MSEEQYNNHILFVDDEVNYLNSIKRALIDEPYIKHFVNSAIDGLKVLKSEEIAVVVSDLKMPHIDGMEFLQLVKNKHPDTIRIIVTGISDVPSIMEALHAGETHRYLIKPVNIEHDLIPTIRQSIELYNIKFEKKKMIDEILSMNKKLKEKNEEINFFKRLVEDADDKKAKLLVKIHKEILPLMKIMKEIQDISDQNKKEQEKIQFFDMVENRQLVLDDILKEIEQYFVHIDYSRY